MGKGGVVITHDEEEYCVYFRVSGAKFNKAIEYEEEISKTVEVLSVEEARGYASAGAGICESISSDEYHIVIPCVEEVQHVGDACEHLFGCEVRVGGVIVGGLISMRDNDEAFKEMSPKEIGNDAGEALVKSGPVDCEKGTVGLSYAIKAAV